MVLIHFSKNDISFNLLRTEISSVLSESSQSLSELTVVSVSSIWREILKMSFLLAGKTDFLRFCVIPNATVSLVSFVKNFAFFSERNGRGGDGGRREEHFETVFFYLFCLFASVFFLFAAVSLRALESCFSSSESKARLSDK